MDNNSCVVHPFYQAMGALDEKTKAERALKDLQKVQGEQQVLRQACLAVNHLAFAFHLFFRISVTFHVFVLI